MLSLASVTTTSRTTRFDLTWRVKTAVCVSAAGLLHSGDTGQSKEHEDGEFMFALRRTTNITALDS